MIKPYLNYCVHIKSLSAYRDFLKKRPTKAHHFKFSTIQTQHKLARADEKQVQLRLLRTLKNFKPVIKVDLRECGGSNHGFWKATLLSVFKRISHIKAFCVFGPKYDFEANSLKHFAKLKNLVYEVEGYPFHLDPSRDRNKKKSLETARNYLASLRYCPKICQLNYVNFSESYPFPKISIRSNRYFKSLESLVIRNRGYHQDRFDFLIECWKNLKSISLQFSNPKYWDQLPYVMNALPKLPNLQEIHLSCIRDLLFDFEKAFNQITTKGMLKKVSLQFGSTNINLENVLESLKPSKLTYFSFKARNKGGLVKLISQFIKDMISLETLEFHIINSNFLSKDDNFIEMCRHINKLQALRNLTLNFQASAEVSKSTTKVLNFIPHLCDTFKKPIKIETLHIECSQLDSSSEAFESLMTLLQNSALFLTHLKIEFGTLTCTKKAYRSLLKLLQSLSKIQALQIPCLSISDPTSQFLSEISEVLSESKYLRVLEIGQVKDTAMLPAFYKTVEIIMSKRGLRQFRCLLGHNFRKTSKKDEKIQGLNLKRILEKNPYLETISPIGKPSEFSFEPQKWTGY